MLACKHDLKALHKAPLRNGSWHVSWQASHAKHTVDPCHCCQHSPASTSHAGLVTRRCRMSWSRSTSKTRGTRVLPTRRCSLLARSVIEAGIAVGKLPLAVMHCKCTHSLHNLRQQPMPLRNSRQPVPWPHGQSCTLASPVMVLFMVVYLLLVFLTLTPTATGSQSRRKG